MHAAMASEWDRFFANWERLVPDERGFLEVGDVPAALRRTSLGAFATSLGIFVTCLREAPELAAWRRMRQLGQGR